MKYLLLFIIIPAIYAFSFAKHTWKEKNKIGSAGVLLITAISVTLSFYYVLYGE